MPIDKSPTPDEIAPTAIPPLDEQWVAVVMNEIAAFIRKKQADLQARKIIRYMPSGYYHTGHAATQWKYYARHIAEQVRRHGWTAYLVGRIDGEYYTLTISTPNKEITPAQPESSGD